MTQIRADTYVSKYKLPAVNCATSPASQNDVTWFYQDPSPIFDFENRLTHILQHRNQLLPDAPQWKDLPGYILSFNIQNEGQGHLRGNIAPAPSWWCDRSKKMRSIMGSSSILISTGKPPNTPLSFVPFPSTTNLMITTTIQVAGTSSQTPIYLRTGPARPLISSTFTRTAAFLSSATKRRLRFSAPKRPGSLFSSRSLGPKVLTKRMLLGSTLTCSMDSRSLG